MGSGWPGGSTLITSAPMSPSSRPVKGPASSMPSSITRTPASGPGPFVSRCAAGASVACSVMCVFGLAHARDEDIAGFEDVLFHHQLRALGVAGLERLRDLAV